jgi:glycosyltransferase involved in cell wall biosynthesis
MKIDPPPSHMRMTRGLVSVIIPAYNAAEHIRRTLNSVLAQTYQALEVIVVDDGSADATCAIVEEFVKKDARVQLVRQCNAGVGAARNTAIRMARGEYIAPLDADDIWFPEKLEKQVACMEQNGEETGLVYCWCILVDKNGEFEGASYGSKAEGRLGDAMVSGCFVGSASVPLFRTAALTRVGLYLTRAEQGGAQGCEDWDLYIRLAETFSICPVAEFLVAYRKTNSSMSVDTQGMAASFAIVMERTRLRNPALPTAIFRRSAWNFYGYLLSICNQWGDDSRSFNHLKKALCADPANLLKIGTLKQLIKLQLKAIPGSTWKKFVKQLWQSLKNRRAADVQCKTDKRPFTANAIFGQIERRWSTLQGQY